MFNGTMSPSRDQVDAVKETFKGKGYSNLCDELGKTQNTLKKVKEEAGTEWDFTKVNAVGGTDDEKRSKVQNLFANRRALMNLIRAKETEALEASESDAANDLIRRQNAYQNNNSETIMPRVVGQDPIPATREFYTNVAKHIQNKGGHLNAGMFNIGESTGAIRCNLNSLLREPYVNAITTADVMRTGDGSLDAQAGMGFLRFPPLRDDFEFYRRRQVKIWDFLSQNSETLGMGSQLAVRRSVEVAPTGTVAAQTAEATAYSKRKFSSKIVTTNLVKMGEYVPFSLEEVLSVPGFMNRVQQIIRQDLLLEIENQIVSSNTNDLKGILNLEDMQTEAQPDDGTANIPKFGIDFIDKAVEDVFINGHADPNAILMNPTDLQKTRVVRDDNNNRMVVKETDTGLFTISGLPVLKSVVIPAGTVVVGDFNRLTVLMLEGIVVQIGTYDDGFIKDAEGIKARAFIGLLNRRGQAFKKITSYQAIDKS